MFKRDSEYTAILEHVSYEQGLEYLSLATAASPEFISSFKNCQKNDLLGSPTTFVYPNYGTFSPTTLRYIKVASDLKTHFGSLDNFSIVEIGGGYGGQCLILSTLFKIKKYTIIDLPESLALTKKYLEMHGIDHVEFLTHQEVRENQVGYDLAISNYAFSECVSRWQVKYTIDIFQHCSRGYLTCNSDLCVSAGALSIKQIRDLFARWDLFIREYSEQPLTAPGNCIFIWDKSS